jgi:hypothetical protein
MHQCVISGKLDDHGSWRMIYYVGDWPDRNGALESSSWREPTPPWSSSSRSLERRIETPGIGAGFPILFFSLLAQIISAAVAARIFRIVQHALNRGDLVGRVILRMPQRA